MTKQQALAALTKRCRRWGGRLVILAQEEFDALPDSGLSMAPFISAHAIDWTARIIYVVKGRADVPAILHEMGHVFASRRSPWHSKEFSFFGWEYLLAKELGITRAWAKSNQGYSVGDDGTLYADLTPQQRKRVVQTQILKGIKLGIISKGHVPLTVR